MYVDYTHTHTHSNTYISYALLHICLYIFTKLNHISSNVDSNPIYIYSLTQMLAEDDDDDDGFWINTDKLKLKFGLSAKI